MQEVKKNYDDIFNTLFAVDCSDKVKQANGHSYLSWAYAWGEVKKLYPRSFYTVYERHSEDGNDIPYFTDGRTCWVKTGVTVVSEEEAIEMVERLPIMDFRNASIPLDKVTSRDVNDTIQRSLTKACARHGLGLFVYAGEDVPEERRLRDEQEEKLAEEVEKKRKTVISVAQKKIADGVAKETVYDVIRNLNNDDPNPNSINDPAVLDAVLSAIRKLKKVAQK